MLKPANSKSGYCFERALEAQQRALAAADAFAREEFLASEARWRNLAESYEFSESLANPVKTAMDFPKHPVCSKCDVPMWLLEIQSSPETVTYSYGCKICDEKAELTDQTSTAA